MRAVDLNVAVGLGLGRDLALALEFDMVVRNGFDMVYHC